MIRIYNKFQSRLFELNIAMTFTANHKTYHELPRPVAGTLPTSPLLRISSQDILKGRQEVEIEHNGMLYRFRCTSLGKLILTK